MVILNTENTSIKDDVTIEQKLSILVRARLLFQREIEIDRGSDVRKFDQAYLLRILEMKQLVDTQMQRLLLSATGSTLLFYLVGKGMDPVLPLWGLKLTSVPGVLVFISLFSAYAMSMAAYSFYNSQSYSALIDQIILDQARDGILDVDMIKASHEAEWLIFKALRADFSFYAPVHIKYKGFGRFFSSLTFATISIVAMLPFLVLICAVPYLAIIFLENDFIGLATKSFIFLCVISVFFLITLTSLGFTCEVNIHSA